MTRKLAICASLAITAALVLAGCHRAAPPAKPPEAGDQAAAKVGDKTIWVSDVKREAVAEGLIGDGEPLDVTSQLFHQVLLSVIDEKLLAAEARTRGIENDAAAKHRLELADDRILGDILLENNVQKGVTSSIRRPARPARHPKNSRPGRSSRPARPRAWPSSGLSLRERPSSPWS